MTLRAGWFACAMGMAASFAAPAGEIGAAFADLTFKDTRYLERRVTELGSAKAYVLVFTASTCPIANRYMTTLDEMAASYAESGVRFALVNAAADDTIADAALHALEYGVTIPMLKDMDGAGAKALGVMRTPECVVLTPDMRLVYRGRIDDQFRFDGAAPKVSQTPLKDAIDAVLAGEAPAVATTPVDGCEITPSIKPAGSDTLTFAGDIAPIIHGNCTACHRPGTAAPFSLVTYKDVAARANMIAEVVWEGRMPPWYAHESHGSFMNARRLDDADRDKLVAWALGAKAQGDLANAPAPPAFPDAEWQIGEPDLFIQAAKPFDLPATGYIDYQYIILPHLFTEDTWVQGIQIKPSNANVVHHANLVYVDEKKKYDGANAFLTGLVPGGLPAIMQPEQAMLIPAGSALVLQVHYVTTGKPESDRIGVGIRFAEGPIKKRVRYKIVEDDTFAIAPGAAMHKTFAARTIEEDATLLGLFSHMHLRGRDMTFVAKYPDGATETLLTLPNYNFDWQLSYLYPPETKRIPKGTAIEVTAHFDNSAFNPFNPDPSAEVKNGPQTHEEMMIGYVFYTRNDESLDMIVDGATGKAVEKVADARP